AFPGARAPRVVEQPDCGAAPLRRVVPGPGRQVCANSGTSSLIPDFVLSLIRLPADQDVVENQGLAQVFKRAKNPRTCLYAHHRSVLCDRHSTQGHSIRHTPGALVCLVCWDSCLRLKGSITTNQGTAGALGETVVYRVNIDGGAIDSDLRHGAIPAGPAVPSSDSQSRAFNVQRGQGCTQNDCAR